MSSLIRFTLLLAIALLAGCAAAPPATRSITGMLVMPPRPDAAPGLICVSHFRPSGDEWIAIINMRYCDGRARLAKAGYPRSGPVSTPFGDHLVARLRASGKTVDYRPAVAGPALTATPQGLQPAYAAAPGYDVVVDYAINYHGFTTTKDADGREWTVPFIQGVVQLVNARTGKPYLRRPFHYGPYHFTDKNNLLWIPPRDDARLPRLDAFGPEKARLDRMLADGAQSLADAVGDYLATAPAPR